MAAGHVPITLGSSRSRWFITIFVLTQDSGPDLIVEDKVNNSHAKSPSRQDTLP